jgi:hypothetical protein
MHSGVTSNPTEVKSDLRGVEEELILGLNQALQQQVDMST